MAFTGNNTNESTKVSQLPLYLIEYKLRGEINSFRKLNGELLECPHNSYENQYSVLFGTSYKMR